MYFSNSLIIHEANQRKQPKVWKNDLIIIIKVAELLLWFSKIIISGVRSNIENLKEGFILFLNTFKVVKYTSAAAQCSK